MTQTMTNSAPQAQSSCRRVHKLLRGGFTRAVVASGPTRMWECE